MSETHDAKQPPCICSPAGHERFFAEVGERVSDRTTPPPTLDAATQAVRMAKAKTLSSQYRTELLPPSDAS